MKAIFLNARSTVVGNVNVIDGIAVPDEGVRELLDDTNVVEPSTFALLSYDDGERYVLALPHVFRPPYLWAAIVEDDAS